MIDGDIFIIVEPYLVDRLYAGQGFEQRRIFIQVSLTGIVKHKIIGGADRVDQVRFVTGVYIIRFEARGFARVKIGETSACIKGDDSRIFCVG